MKKIRLLLFLSTIILLNSCASVYHSPEADKRVSKHKIIAVLPPKVSIDARKKIDVEAIKEQQKTESLVFQGEMYSWLMKRKSQNKMFIEVLDVETTNAKLKKTSYFEENTMTPSEISELLGVDAVITSTYKMTKPMSEGAAIALGVLVGIWGPTNTANVTVELHDKETKKLLWNFNHEISGSVMNSPSQLVNALMRKASRRMPYIVK